MAQFLRGKQAGVHTDLSAGLKPELFFLDIVARYGINSQISALAYDPVQSLLAAGTNDSQFGRGQIYVFGQSRVELTLSLPRQSSIKGLQFCARRLIAVDSKNDISIFDLQSQKLEASYSPPGRIMSIASDSTLDYIFVGLQNGEVMAYDMDGQKPAQLRIPCLCRDFNPRANMVPVVSVNIHPRDIGTMLIAYADGVAVYSFKQNKAVTFLQYQLPSGAPGGFSDPSLAKGTRCPKVVQATWHPSGMFILTGHDDGSLVIWDPKTGSIVQAMTLHATNVNKPEATPKASGFTAEKLALKAPLTRVAWCCKKNPDDTALVVAGGLPTDGLEKGLTFIELGPTPTYQTSTWQALSDHFENPKGRHLLRIPTNTDIVDFCLIPRSSPHHAGCCDPVAVIAILSSGELAILSIPSGYPISVTNQLHPSLAFICPFVSKISLASIGRIKWLSMTEKRSRGPALVRGGAGSTQSLMRFEDRHILQTAHVDGTVRMWDVGRGDKIENEEMLQVDVARASSRVGPVCVTDMSLSSSTGEFSVGLDTGEVLIFRWGRNQNFSREVSVSHGIEAHGLMNIAASADPDLKEGLLPLTMLSRTGSAVTAIRTSDIGFVAVGHQNGSFSVVDLRGPALIYEAQLAQFTDSSKRTSIRRNSKNQDHTTEEWPTVIEFAVMSLEGEGYSSIILLVGTNSGRLYTFKVLPNPQGTFSIQLAGSTLLNDKIIAISPLDADTGRPATASQSAVSALRDGNRINGVVVAVTVTGVRVFKPALAKGASKAWNDFFCDAAALVSNFDNATALVALFGDGYARTYSVPALKELAAIKVSNLLDVRRFPEAIIAPTGEIFGWSGPSEIIVLNPWGAGQDKTISDDQLVNPDLLIPPRPTISNMQWISGTQYFTAAHLDELVGGPGRRTSKRMLEQMQADDRQRREATKATAATSNAPGQEDEGYWSSMQRSVQERTERLNIMGDSMDRLEEASAGWADDVSKFVNDQKKKAVMGVISSKFGF